MDLKLREVDEEKFLASKKDWNILLGKSSSISFFLKWEWLYSFWKTINVSDVKLFVCFIYDRDILVGIAPFYKKENYFLGRKISTISLLGDLVASDYLDIFTAVGYEDACCSCFLDHALKNAYKIELRGLLESSNLLISVKSKNSEKSYSALLMETVLSPSIVRTSDCSEDFITRPSKNTRYLKRKLFKNYPSIEMYSVGLNKGMRFIEELFHLHRSRWDRIVNRSSTFDSDYRRAFNRYFLDISSDSDGYFSILEIDRIVISVLYIFKFKNRCFYYQNGWDPCFENYSLGKLHLRDEIERSFDSGIDTFDMLRGDESYKISISNSNQILYNINVFSNNYLGLSTYFFAFAKNKIKLFISYLRTKI